MSDAAVGGGRAGVPAGPAVPHGSAAERGPAGALGAAPGVVGASLWDVGLVAIGGALACSALAMPPPATQGARVLLSAPVLLGAFDTMTALLIARPAAHRGAPDVLALLVVAAPFHVALAAGAGVPLATVGYHAAWAVSLVAWGAAGVVAARAGRGGTGGAGGASVASVASSASIASMPAAILACIAAGVPLVAYGAAEFLGWRSRAPFLMSPLTGPAFLAHAGAFASASDSLWALAGAAAVAIAALVDRNCADGAR